MAKPHIVLGIVEDAPMTVVREAYKRKAMKLHPDRPGGSAEEFTKVQAAYDALRAKHEARGMFDDIFETAARELKSRQDT